ncbi:MAG: hypothetical protein NTV54_01050 [Ignavibacteriales bacterium]|nr:hypothetical protein [Ignavibacteriales bacterium]
MNSHRLLKKYNRIPAQLLTILCFYGSVIHLQGQDFGETAYDLAAYRAIGGGVSLQHFRPAGGNSLSDSAGIKFSNPQIHAEYRDPDTRIVLGYSSYLLKGKSGAALSCEIESRREFPLIRGNRRSGLFLPVCLSTNYVRAANTANSIRDVNIVSLGLGTGLDARLIQRNFGVEVRGSGVFHYSTQSFSVDDGTSNLFSGEIVILLPELVGRGLVIGYHYEFQTWKMKRSDLNYQREIHGPFLDIFF